MKALLRVYEDTQQEAPEDENDTAAMNVYMAKLEEA
jgi:hypothetical protein